MHKIIHDVETGEIMQIELNQEELDDLQKRTEENSVRFEALVNATKAKAAEKAALLAKLGITEAEAKLLLS